jgi:hypothetical protein
MKIKILIIFFFLETFANAQVIPVGFVKQIPGPPLPAINTTGLILHLDATNTSSYKGSGTTWNDLSGQNNNPTLVGNPTLSSNPASFRFALGKYASTTKSDISLTTATFIAWVYPTQTQNNYTGIIFSRNGNPSGLNLHSNNSVGYHWNGSNYDWNNGDFLKAPNNTWSMIAVSVSASSATAYLCEPTGISKATKSATHSAVSSLKFYIAVDPSYLNSREFIGKIATAVVYNFALTEAEITSIYNSQKSYF